MTDEASGEKPTPEQFLAIARVADYAALSAFLCESVGEPDSETSHYPAWVRRGAEKVNQARFPKVFEVAKSGFVPKHYSLGVAFGLMLGGQAKAKSAEKLLPAGMPEPTSEQIEAGWKWLYGDNAANSTMPDDGSLIAKEIQEEIKRVEADSDASEVAGLHRGIADATAMIAGDDKATETTKIYETMVVFWRVVERFRSARELHEWLVRALGQGVVGGDVQRISQMCRRIGKNFRPGRPRKTTST